MFGNRPLFPWQTYRPFGVCLHQTSVTGPGDVGRSQGGRGEEGLKKNGMQLGALEGTRQANMKSKWKSNTKGSESYS